MMEAVDLYAPYRPWPQYWRAIEIHFQRRGLLADTRIPMTLIRGIRAIEHNSEAWRLIWDHQTHLLQ